MKNKMIKEKIRIRNKIQAPLRKKNYQIFLEIPKN